jgi:hypothetical protein
MHSLPASRVGDAASYTLGDAHQPGMRSCAGWGQKCPADETYPNCVNGLPYLRDKDSLPTDSVQFALTETRSSILDTTEPIPESVHQRIIAQDVE